MNISGASLLIILGVLFVLLIVCIILLVLYIIKFRKYEEKYNQIFKKFENKSIEEDIKQLTDYMDKTRIMSEEAKMICDSLDGKMLKSIQKVGLVKYDAYDGGNNGLSFALSILNGKNDGVLINSIYTRNGSNIYAKEISEGTYNGNLSDEENKALQIAKNQKTFM